MRRAPVAANTLDMVYLALLLSRETQVQTPLHAFRLCHLRRRAPSYVRLCRPRRGEECLTTLSRGWAFSCEDCHQTQRKDAFHPPCPRRYPQRSTSRSDNDCESNKKPMGPVELPASESIGAFLSRGITNANEAFFAMLQGQQRPERLAARVFSAWL
ncbi:uncharacterized protein K452DRAFT_71294 [Aplosporella prunicola CBS 121167]|uniref:Uncharacterized protein n=1 Tax=Aplosporella prunicola CBS 121167 TaxID=1176127 RepID=A0A6A6BU71_9PEZI|nr:uncharacterized protein K452DRAFT_71294 [Aplosporella prunicola CBS 121167]KAF2146815.1 hypothetical protein K452DRAFT_71294 [Aplosporella prunicola CBS 121167]